MTAKSKPDVTNAEYTAAYVGDGANGFPEDRSFVALKVILVFCA